MQRMILRVDQKASSNEDANKDIRGKTRIMKKAETVVWRGQGNTFATWYQKE